MKILKIIDGFITNSSTNTTTLLLAIEKNEDLLKLLESIGLPADYPLDFFDFTTHQSEVEEFLLKHGVNIAYIRKNYNLAYNIIENHGPENEAGGDELHRFYLVEKMVKELEAKLDPELKVLCWGDCLHDGFPIKTQPIYSKQEFQSVFKTDQVMLIKSLLKNNVVDTIPFTKEELIEITQNLKIPIENLLELDEYHDCYRYEPELYKVFGKEYLKTLLKIVKINPNRDPHAEHYLYGINEYKIRLINRNINDSLHMVEFFGPEGFKDELAYIYSLFGIDEVIKFFKNKSCFEMISKIDETNYMDSYKLKLIAEVVTRKKDDTDKTIQDIKNTLHSIIIDKLASSMKIVLNSFDTRKLQALLHILEPYDEHNQLSMILPIVTSLPPESIANLSSTSWPERALRKILEKTLKMK